MTNRRHYHWAAVTGLALLMLLGCEQELSIYDFEGDWGDYRPEVRIEAVLNTVDLMSSVVRIDRTILVTDTTIFNERDDDEDWVGYEDLNGNGEWDKDEPLNHDVGEDGLASNIEYHFGFVEPDEGEGNGVPDPGEPNVDEYDEILPLLHIRDATVDLYDLDSGTLLAEFQWTATADSFEIQVETEFDSPNFGNDIDSVYQVPYGGYKPVIFHDSVHAGGNYEFRINVGDQHIIGAMTPLPMAQFVLDDTSMVDDTLLVQTGGSKLAEVNWITDAEATVTWAILERVITPDSLVLIGSQPAAGLPRDDGGWDGIAILAFLDPGLYRMTVVVPDRHYGVYIYSRLPMDDTAVSNLRDDDGSVVLGIAGSVTPVSQYVRLIK